MSVPPSIVVHDLGGRGVAIGVTWLGAIALSVALWSVDLPWWLPDEVWLLPTVVAAAIPLLALFGRRITLADGEIHVRRWGRTRTRALDQLRAIHHGTLWWTLSFADGSRLVWFPEANEAASAVLANQLPNPPECTPRRIRARLDDVVAAPVCVRCGRAPDRAAAIAVRRGVHLLLTEWMREAELPVPVCRGCAARRAAAWAVWSVASVAVPLPLAFAALVAAPDPALGLLAIGGCVLLAGAALRVQEEVPDLLVYGVTGRLRADGRSDLWFRRATTGARTRVSIRT